MARITLTGCDPYDGTYPIDFTDPFDTGDLQIIKAISGVRAGEIEEASAAGDSDLAVALAVIALRRAGKVSRKQAMMVADKIFDGALLSLEPDEETDAVPPAQPPTGGANASSRSASGSASNAGTGSQG